MEGCMAITAKMPGIGCYCVNTLCSDDGIIGLFGIVWPNVIVSPIMVIGYLRKIIVAIEENMLDTV